ncbi:hypothetical protein BC835DRAFT_393323 [Cytidiella melzeri]|nr:hypothetical protein BC835DRAFT_393323 [Cytidiella melzeri]
MDATPVIAGRIASAQTLPFEMLDLIFTGLAQDARSLSQCSLVCKVWSNRARRQLFRTIVLAISHQNAIKEILRFLQNLRDSHWIRTVIYRGCWEPLRPLFLVTCLDMLPELESLVLDQVELSCDYHNVQVGPHRKFRLGTLDLRRVSFLTSHSMMDIICVFAEIDTIIAKVISLGGDSLVDVTTWAPSSLDVTKPTVLNLRATQDCAAGSITWLYKVLGTYISPGSLTSLDLACITRASVHSFCTWMSKDGSRITSLRLDLSSEGSLLNAKARRPNTRIKLLALELICSNSDSPLSSPSQLSVQSVSSFPKAALPESSCGQTS